MPARNVNVPIDALLNAVKSGNQKPNGQGGEGHGQDGPENFP